MAVPLTRQEMQTKLRQVFPAQQAEGLVEVLDNFRELEVQRAADTRELKQGLANLTAEVAKLAEAQRHTDERMGEMVEAQRHTDERMGEMVEAQRRTDERIDKLAASLDRLAEAQRHTDEGLRELRVAVGSLTQAFGFSLEEFVAALLPSYLERHYSISGAQWERGYFTLGTGRQEEVDLVADGKRDGQPVTILVECRSTVGGSEVRRLAEKLRMMATLLAPREVVRVIVAMNVHPSALTAGEETGVLVIPYSRVYREGLREAAKG